MHSLRLIRQELTAESYVLQARDSVKYEEEEK